MVSLIAGGLRARGTSARWGTYDRGPGISVRIDAIDLGCGAGRIPDRHDAVGGRGCATLQRSRHGSANRRKRQSRSLQHRNGARHPMGRRGPGRRHGEGCRCGSCRSGDRRTDRRLRGCHGVDRRAHRAGVVHEARAARASPHRPAPASPCSPPTSRSMQRSQPRRQSRSGTPRPPCRWRPRCGSLLQSCGGVVGSPLRGARSRRSGFRCSHCRAPR
jgi:hypothetical protein